ncbi:RNA-directed DNA polymerase (Reverse transcriptase) [Tenacibaculum sp. 190524A02b]|uniref:RNA-directed DNA polymerase (Reverse transcriptase) n=1 Tax=Tenacibaculum vairaonense TaxID=3137860 RepID=A0ABP1FFV2_9FLAO
MKCKKKKDWFKNRGYVHFTNKIPFKHRNFVYKYVSNPEKIAKHSFSPLIFKEIKQRRYKESDFNGKKRYSHKKIKENKITSNSKIRQILYSSHIDAHIYSYYTQRIITPKYEAYLNKYIQLTKAITAYRQIKTDDRLKYKNNINFAKEVFSEIKRRENCVALVLDIENFFPSLNHNKLKKAWAKVLGNKTLPKDHYNIFRATTRFSYIKLNDLRIKKGHFDEKKLSENRKKGKNSFFENIKELIESDIIIHKNQIKDKNKKLQGIPQGLPISALLANIYMLSFDESIITNLTQKQNVFYRRYSDDIIILCEENQIKFVENFIINEIQKIDLIISKDKTEKILFKKHNKRLQSFKINMDGTLHFNFPLNYLGFEFYGYQTLIKSKNLAQFYRSMKQSVRRKNKRVEKVKEKFLEDQAPLFKRKIYRLYSFKGVKTRKLPVKGNNYTRKFRGNYLRYAYKASEELEAPEIKRQLRNHWTILQKTLSTYEFSNVKKNN